MDSYIFRYKGEVKEAYEVEKVQSDLASLFSVGREELDGIFGKRQYFLRSGLSGYTALQYKEVFARLGALGHVEKDLSRSSDSSVEYQGCPKCKSPLVFAGMCQDCGIFLDKYSAPTIGLTEVTDDTPSDSYSPQTGSNPNPDLSRAILTIKWGAMMLVATFILDEYLQQLQFMGRQGFDIGWFTFVPGTLLLTYGCWFLSKGKGYSGYIGLFGVFNIFGLGILMLLPDKYLTHRTQIPILHKSNLFALVLIGASVYWVAAYIGKVQDHRLFISDASELRADRHEYPSLELDVSADLIDQEFAELERFIVDTIDLIDDGDYRPAEVKEISDVMFFEVARIGIWLNYQQYRQYSAGGDVPDHMRDQVLVQSKVDLLKGIVEQIEGMDYWQPRLAESFNEWFIYGANYLDNDGGMDRFWAMFNSQLYRVRENIFTDRLARKITESERSSKNHDAPALPVVNLRNISMPNVDGVNVSGDNDRITFRSERDEFIDSPLVMAFYHHPYSTWRGTGYHLRQVQISPEFPNKYLWNNHKAFNAALSKLPANFGPVQHRN